MGIVGLRAEVVSSVEEMVGAFESRMSSVNSMWASPSYLYMRGCWEDVKLGQLKTTRLRSRYRQRKRTQRKSWESMGLNWKQMYLFRKEHAKLNKDYPRNRKAGDHYLGKTYPQGFNTEKEELGKSYRTTIGWFNGRRWESYIIEMRGRTRSTKAMLAQSEGWLAPNVTDGILKVGIEEDVMCLVMRTEASGLARDCQMASLAELKSDALGGSTLWEEWEEEEEEVEELVDLDLGEGA